MRRSDSPGNAGEVRRINLMFWVTPHENELIRRRMAQAGTANLSAYLRKMAIDALIVHLELPELKEMISLLRRCAGSLNQMAKRMNETGRVYEVDLREVMEQQERLWTMANALLFCVSEKKGEKRPETLQKEKKSIGRPTIHPSFPRGPQTKKTRQNHPETIQKKRRNAMPRMSRKRREEWDFFLNRRNRITYNDLCRNCRHDCKQSFRAQIVACRKYRSKRSETWR